MVVDSITDIRKSSIVGETGKLYQNVAFPGLTWNEMNFVLWQLSLNYDIIYF